MKVPIYVVGPAVGFIVSSMNLFYIGGASDYVAGLFGHPFAAFGPSIFLYVIALGAIFIKGWISPPRAWDFLWVLSGLIIIHVGLFIQLT